MERSYINTSDSFEDTVTDVADSLLDFAISDFVETLYEARAAKKISAKIHQAEGQLPKFMFILGDNSGYPPVSASRTKNATQKTTKTILVKNIPATADDELLEVFFESTKKQGGGPVQNVKILRDKDVAFVEFCDRSSVERVLKKRPIKLGTTVLDIESYNPLLQGPEKIKRVDVIGLPSSFTDSLLKDQLETILSPQDGSTLAETKRKTKVGGRPSPQAITQNLASQTKKKSKQKTTSDRDNLLADSFGYVDENEKFITVGSRVVRGRDWDDGNRDGAEGTVIRLDKYNKWVVRWDNGNSGVYSLGYDEHYEIKLAK